MALGKFLFAEEVYAGWLLPKVTLGKGVAGGFWAFAECPWHSAYMSISVVLVTKMKSLLLVLRCQHYDHMWRNC